MILLCIMGKSGCGKSTLERKLEEIGYKRIISYTTRGPRGAEVDGIDYRFVSKHDFERLIFRGVLMEYTIYNGNYYGAPKPIGSERYVIVVETEGYNKIKELYGDQAVGVYIDTPDHVTQSRLEKRGDTNKEVQEQRRIEDERFKGIEAEVVLDGEESVNKHILDIMTYLKGREDDN